MLATVTTRLRHISTRHPVSPGVLLAGLLALALSSVSALSAFASPLAPNGGMRPSIATALMAAAHGDRAPDKAVLPEVRVQKRRIVALKVEAMAIAPRPANTSLAALLLPLCTPGVQPESALTVGTRYREPVGQLHESPARRMPPGQAPPRG